MPFVDWVAMGQKFRRFPAGDAVEQVIQVTREQGRRFGIGEAAGDLPLELERAGFAEPDVGVLNADLKEHLSDYIWRFDHVCVTSVLEFSNAGDPLLLARLELGLREDADPPAALQLWRRNGPVVCQEGDVFRPTLNVISKDLDHARSAIGPVEPRVDHPILRVVIVLQNERVQGEGEDCPRLEFIPFAHDL